MPTPSAGLVSALGAARKADMAALVSWAQQRANAGRSNASVNAVITSVLALPHPDRDAVLFWLEGHGRGAVHAQGAGDDIIGVPYYALDYAVVAAPFPGSVTPLVIPTPFVPPAPPQPQHRTNFGLLGAMLPALHIPIASSSSSSSLTSTTQSGSSVQTDQTFSNSGTSVSVSGNPWEAVGSLIDATANRPPQHAPAPPLPWRSLPFAASSLGTPGSQIIVNRGFAAVRSDGTQGAACISFVNQSPKQATQIDVDIEILDGLGLIKRVQALRRTGSFAPGVEIGGPADPQTLESARANCVIDGENSLADLTDPFADASAVAYSVRQVLYTDGTSWLQPGANPWTPAP